jgi:L-aspartate oxidase
MSKYRELLELAPRDVVSRAIFQEMTNSNSNCVGLDITFKGKEYLENRFPNIYKTCLEYGIDMAKDYIPVAPAEHYCMGGIRTDVHGRTNIDGLYACGEVACTGIHGANRLASNSLLEGLVFGRKIAQDIADKEPEEISGTIDTSVVDKYYVNCEKDELLNELKAKIQITMTKYVGIIRNQESLEKASGIIKGIKEEYKKISGFSLTKLEVGNMLLVSSLVIEAALERKESRGAHFRSDFSETDNINWRRNIIKVYRRD